MDIDQFNPRDPAWDTLWTLFGAYFHQDFDADFDDWQSAINFYRSGSSPSQVSRTIEQLENFLDTFKSEDEIERATELLGLDVFPETEEVTYRYWLEQVINVLRQEN